MRGQPNEVIIPRNRTPTTFNPKILDSKLKKIEILEEDKEELLAICLKQKELLDDQVKKNLKLLELVEKKDPEIQAAIDLRVKEIDKLLMQPIAKPIVKKKKDPIKPPSVRIQSKETSKTRWK